MYLLQASDIDEAKQDREMMKSGGHIFDQKKLFGELPDVLQDIIIAGAHSTSIVFHWTVLLLVLHKDEQDKVLH